MSEKTLWYIHLAGEIFGPVDTKTVAVMLAQNRVQFVDFIWTEAFSNWERISDIDLFAELMPERPKIPVPSVKVSPSGPKIRMKGAELPKSSLAQEFLNQEIPTTPLKRMPPKMRRHVQVLFAGQVEIMDHGSYAATNLREGGMMLKAKNPLPIGMEVRLRLKLPGEELDMTGLVVRHSSEKEPPGFAVEFTRVNPAHKKLIQQFLERPEDEK